MLAALLLTATWGVGPLLPGLCPPPIFVGEQVKFIVEQENGKNRREVPAVERTESTTAFYDFRSSSAHTGLEVTGGSVLFLYRNLKNPSGEVGLFAIHGREDPQQGNARVEMIIRGLPAGTTIAQGDERDEVFWTTDTEFDFDTPPVSGPNVAGNWRYARNTDGVALAGLPANGQWRLNITARFFQDVSSWAFRFGESHSFDLDMSESVYLYPVTAPVGNQDILLYPQEPGEQTYCALAEEEGSTNDIKYTFSWGDNSVTEVVRPAGVPACATHYFCGAISSTCEGVFPRMVTVAVESTCGLPFPVTKVLANEELGGETCPEGVLVSVDGVRLQRMEVAEGGPEQLSRIPPQFQGMGMYVPGAVAANARVQLLCCGGRNCDFIVATYHCPPCSRELNGGLPALLPVDGWVAGSCAPRFGAYDDQMTAFRRVTDLGDVQTFSTTSPAVVIVIFASTTPLADWCPRSPRNCNGPCPPGPPCVCRRGGN